MGRSRRLSGEMGLLSWFKKERPLVWLMALVTAAYSLMACIRHWRFESGGIDLGVFDQIIWHYSRFEAPSSSFLGLSNALGDHFNPILALISPLYWIFPGPEILFVLQAFAVALSTLPVFRFIQRRLGRQASYLWTIAYVVFWGLQAALGCDFLPDLLAVPLIAFAVDFMDSGNNIGFYSCLILLLTVKEDLSLLIFFFGIYLLIKRQWLKGLISMGLGMGAFCLLTMVLMAHLSGTPHYSHWGNFSDLGNSPAEAVQTAIRNPFLILKIMFSNSEKVATLACSFAASLFLDFLSPLLVLAIPGLAERMLSSFEHHYSMGYYYSATVAPLVIMGGADGLRRMAGWFSKPTLSAKIVTAVSWVVLVLNLSTVPVFPLRDLLRWKYYRFSDQEGMGPRVLAMIPPEASVIAQDSIAAHLAHRQNILLIDPSTCSKDCDYFVACDGLPAWPMDGFASIEQCVQQRLRQGYTKVFEGDGWILLKK